MFESKYGKTLTVILVIVVVAIIGLLGFLGYQVYDKNKKVKEASEFVDNYNGGESSSNLSLIHIFTMRQNYCLQVHLKKKTDIQEKIILLFLQL